jgi:3-mercaptopyruvate sulfurtransferase SseA
LAEFDEVLELAQRPSPSTEDTLLIDARPASSYESGHIPTSLLLDFPSSLLRDVANFTYLRQPEDLKQHIAQQLGQDKLDEIVSSKATVVNSKLQNVSAFQHLKLISTPACGGGLSAAINWLSLRSLGVDSRLYDEVRLLSLIQSVQKRNIIDTMLPRLGEAIRREKILLE